MLSAYLVAKAGELERCSREPATGERQSSGSTAGGGGAREVLSSSSVSLSTAAGSGDGDGDSGGDSGGDGGTVEASADGTSADADVAASDSDNTNSLESLSALVASGEGGRWRSDWPEKDRVAFRKGIYAFRRDFHRIRAAFLPHKQHGDVVDYFYR